MKLKFLIPFSFFLICGVIWLMFNLRSNSLEPYAGTTPELDLREYFDGDIKAWGIIQDWRGRVTARFDVDIKGTWEGDTGTLEEKFYYYSGRIDERKWVITKNADGTYSGTANDIRGVAQGRQKGSALAWQYGLNMVVDGKTYKVQLDDWMWLMNDGGLFNRSYIKKFGITVAQLTFFMKKV